MGSEISGDVGRKELEAAGEKVENGNVGGSVILDYVWNTQESRI